MIRTLLVLLCLYEVIHQKIAEMTPLYFKRGTIKAFASENIQEKNDLLFCKAHVVCVHQFLVYLLSNVFWGHFSPRFLSSRSRVFSSPYILAFVRISLLLIWVNRESLLSRMIANLTTHLSLEKKCLFNVISASIRIAIFTLSNLEFFDNFWVFAPVCSISRKWSIGYSGFAIGTQCIG